MTMVKWTDARWELVDGGAVNFDGATKAWAPARKPTIAQKPIMERIFQEDPAMMFDH
jgi:hypothetical protein